MKLNFRYTVYPDLTTPNGPLPRDIGAQACWYFFCLCEGTRTIVGDGPSTQIILEGEQWMDKHYEQLAFSTALIYGLKSPDDFWNYWPAVIATAKDIGVDPPNPEYMRRTKPVIFS